MNKKFIIPVVAVALLGTTILGVNQVSAQANQDGRTSIVGKIASTFGLNEADVQGVFDEHKGEMHEQVQAKFVERLDAKVADGTITEDQKNLIIQKHEEMQSQMESYKDMTPEEKKEAMQSHHENLETWAEENSIDIKDLMLGFGKGYHKGFQQGARMGHNWGK